MDVVPGQRSHREIEAITGICIGRGVSYAKVNKVILTVLAFLFSLLFIYLFFVCALAVSASLSESLVVGTNDMD